MLEETLSILAQEQVKGLDEAKVFLPDDLERMERMIGKRAHERAVCRYDCVNMDAFALARRLRQAYPQEKILVLNLANPFEPGGSVDDHFAQISFAVLDRSPDQYNFRAFSRYFVQRDREGGRR